MIDKILEELLMDDLIYLVIDNGNELLCKINDINHNTKLRKFLVENYIIKSTIGDTLHLTLANSEYKNYLHLLENVLLNGDILKSRNDDNILSIDCPNNLVFENINELFPLLTTKKMFIRGIIEELLFFMRGNTNTKLLEEKNVNIWKGNTSRKFLDDKGFFSYEEGEMGPMYGKQWRNFLGIDQLDNLIKKIKNENKDDLRRLLLTDFNPLEVESGVLYPCHSIIIQFFIRDDKLNMFTYNRSSDLFLGLPFNIAMSAIILILIAKCCNKIPYKLTISLGDAHIYRNHIEQVKEQINRIPYKFPKLTINKNINNISDIENLSFEDFNLENYISHPKIIAEMIP